MKAQLCAFCLMAAGAAHAAEPLRIVTFGTSLTQNGGWQQPLAERLSAATGCSVRVFKVARNGAPSTWGLTQLDRVAALKPDAVVVEFAINDAHLRQGIGVSRSVQQMRAIVRRLKQEAGAQGVVIALTNPVRGIGQFLRRPRLNAYFDAHRALGQAEGVQIVDLRPAWRSFLDRNGGAGLPDGLHPTEAAAKGVLPQALAPALASKFAPCRVP